MAAYASVAVLLLAGFAALDPAAMPWVHIAAVAAFEFWLMRKIALAGRGPVAAGEPPYHFSADEAELVARHRFYFMFPGVAHGASSVLAALGLSSVVLVPWLTYRHALLPAALLGLNLFAVARLTRIAAPLLGLRIAASRGDRAALRRLEVLAPAWAKIRAANESAGVS